MSWDRGQEAGSRRASLPTMGRKFSEKQNGAITGERMYTSVWGHVQRARVRPAECSLMNKARRAVTSKCGDCIPGMNFTWKVRRSDGKWSSILVVSPAWLQCMSFRIFFLIDHYTTFPQSQVRFPVIPSGAWEFFLLTCI